MYQPRPYRLDCLLKMAIYPARSNRFVRQMKRYSNDFRIVTSVATIIDIHFLLDAGIIILPMEMAGRWQRCAVRGMDGMKEKLSLNAITKMVMVC